MKRENIHFKLFILSIFTVLLFSFTLMSNGGAVAADIGFEGSGLGSDPHVYEEEDITMLNDKAIGVLASKGANVSFRASVYTSGNGSYGAKTQNGTIHMTGFIDAKGTGSYGAWAYGTEKNKSVAIEVDRYIKAEGNDAIGAYAGWYSTINVKEYVEAKGENSRGVVSFVGSQVNVSKDVKAEGKSAYAVFAQSNAAAQVDGSVFAEGEKSFAVYSLTNSKVIISGDASAKGDAASAVYAYEGYVSISGDVSATDGSSVKAVVANASSVVNIVGNVTAEGTDSALGVSASNSTVTIGGDVNVTGDNSTGLLAYRNANIYINGDAVQVSGSGSRALDVQSGGNIYLDNTIVSVEEDSYLLHGNQSGNIYATNSSKLFGDTVNMRGDLQIILEGDSSLSGAVNDTEENAITNLTLSGAGEVWGVTGDSLMNGTLVNNGLVDYRASGLGTKVTVGNLSGIDAMFVMKTDIAGQTADKLIVDGTTEGSYTIAALNDGSAAATGNEVLVLVETADQEGSFALTNDIELGAWIYSLRQTMNGEGALWEIYASDVSDVASGAINTFAGAYLLGYVETQTLVKRLGDLRETQHLSGLWFKVHGGKFESDAKSFTKEFDMDYWGVQLGYDRKLNIGWDGDTFAGIMLGYSKGDLNFANDAGSGEAKSKMIGIYGTYMADNGFYADTVLKYQWIDNKFNSYDTGGSFVNGDDITTGGFGASLEVGKRFFFDKGKTSGWYAEPQVQLSYMHYDSGYYAATNGLRIGVDDFTSLIGRVGMLIGYETGKASFYAKVSKEKEFKGTVDIYANGVYVAEEDFGSDWWTYGVGFTSRINDRNSVYMDIERSSGGTFTQKWAVKGGWRMLF